MGPHEKVKALNHGLDGREESQVSDIEQIFNKILEENFPKTKKRHPSRYKRHTERTSNRQQLDKKIPATC